jgi:hypothetical protein
MPAKRERIGQDRAAIFPDSAIVMNKLTDNSITDASERLDSRQSTGAVYWEGAVRVSRDGADVGRAYLELAGYANAIRIGIRIGIGKE